MSPTYKIGILAWCYVLFSGRLYATAHVLPRYWHCKSTYKKYHYYTNHTINTLIVKSENKSDFSMLNYDSFYVFTSISVHLWITVFPSHEGFFFFFFILVFIHILVSNVWITIFSPSWRFFFSIPVFVFMYELVYSPSHDRLFLFITVFIWISVKISKVSIKIWEVSYLLSLFTVLLSLN